MAEVSRRSFLKILGGLSASIALPVEVISKVLPVGFSVSPVRWRKQYDLYRGAWFFMADCFVGKMVSETPTKITIENPAQFAVDMMSATEELSEQDKESALYVLKRNAQVHADRLNGLR